MADIRSEPSQVDAPWLTDALEEAGVARGAKVLDVDYVGDIGTGQTGRNSRFTLTWDDGEGRPTSLVGKFPSADAGASMAAFGVGTYLKEFLFYSQVKPTVGIRTPECHVARYDGDAPAFVLLMEDLADCRQGDQLDGLDSDQLALALEQAVALHAPRWGDPTLETFLDTGQPAPTPEQVAMLAQMMYGATLPGFLDRLGDRLDPDIVDMATAFGSLVGAWVGKGAETPPSVIHLDFRADNFLFGQTPDAPPLVVCDWQTLSAGPAMSDIAYVISGSYPDPADRAAAEPDLVEQYRAQLGAAGVEYGADDCWRDYRIGSLWGMVITVIATVQAAETERGNDMLTAMAQRHGRQAIDLDALSLLT